MKSNTNVLIHKRQETCLVAITGRDVSSPLGTMVLPSVTSLILSTHCSTFPCWGGYRKLTGDSIDPAIRVAGGALFGGPIGAAVAAVSVAINRFRGDSADLSSDPTTQVVQVDRPPIALSARLP